ncbi:DUF1203 domain-containing protein [Streptomyces sp. WMMC897]|uniref:DUF1203 domain-containing protein n=1 Tax=Streptomyces sp. WMMC897 TaxID=3014782 RepID=UPI0022B74669|nr:DUF1203 domain-containing protein [Streptomyces sp. WMMC897]MCZ7414376.1 DUF1203 domain-containing protein [Streptomyces sp. WMMC897]
MRRRTGAEPLLFGYRPRLPARPYREVGAGLAHAEPCTGPAGLTGYPPHRYGRPQVLRAYDERGWIHPASTTHDGTNPERAMADVLAEPAGQTNGRP